MLFEKKHEMESMSRDETRVSIVVELLEVYNEKVRDLLTTDKNQDMKVTSNEVVGNISIPTETSEDVMDILNLALTRRCVKATGSNSESSRSHMIFTIHFEVVTKDECNEVNRKGTLHICDLAGSERLSKSGTNNVGVSIDQTR